MGGILGDNLGEGNCESNILSRDNIWTIFAARHQDVSHGLLGDEVHEFGGRFIVLFVRR